MRFLIILVYLFISMPLISQAHEDHKGVEGNPYEEFNVPIEEKQARDFAQFVLNKLVDEKKLYEHWREIDTPTVTRNTFKEESQWIVSYHNPKEIKKDWQTVYIFVGEFGEFRGVNFTGM